jgi:hypothetical protein
MIDGVLVTGNGGRLRDNMHEFLYHRRVSILKRQIRLKGQQELKLSDRHN